LPTNQGDEKFIEEDELLNNPIHTWAYADAATREAATGFVAADLFKIALQQDDNSHWTLTAVTPTWKQVGGDASHSRGHSLINPTDHTDVNVSSPVDQSGLAYDDATGKYIESSVINTVEKLEWPQRLFLGHLMSYPFKGGVNSASDLQYTRIWIPKGITIIEMECFVEEVAGAGSNMRMGLYDQVTPTSNTGVPNNKVGETAVIALTGADEGKFKLVALTSSYLVPTTGFYWTAMITDKTQTKFAVSDTFRAGYLPRREESGTGTTLPATASGLSNPQSATVYVAAVRQV
jgi:hypothetical protein